MHGRQSTESNSQQSLEIKMKTTGNKKALSNLGGIKGFSVVTLEM
ncbi:hypothetical protein ACI8B_210091 [Acinetobacter proteolyticus]|uniref:Uncharacterized protein n=1 Tax=Acinetobacter proteolyticus TaxID=1776741 RepID=A0A653K434_9GAMM|nr:hypothetical protein ACI8B_210091 [Acinetobacter proteolyticus]